MRVLAIGDTHCPGMLPKYVEHLQRIADAWDCDEFVHVGDLVDWHAINFHGRTAGTPNVEREVDLARKQVAKLSGAFPRCHWLIGNHDSLPERQAEKSGLPLDIFRNPIEYWGLPDGWKVYQRWDRVVLDDVWYEHGESGPQGELAAKNQAIANMQSTAVGHLHQNAGVNWFANENKRVFGMSVGCGIDWRELQFRYGRKFKKKPVIACGVVIDGEFPYVEPMLL